MWGWVRVKSHRGGIRVSGLGSGKLPWGRANLTTWPVLSAVAIGEGKDKVGKSMVVCETVKTLEGGCRVEAGVSSPN